jgi:hypothetical protein
MRGLFWEIDEGHVLALSGAVRTLLVNQYGWTNVPAHTHAALIHVREQTVDGVRCLLTFVFSCDASAFVNLTADLEDAIEVDVRARLRALRNAQPLTSIVGRRHWL